jgi:predicted phosphodiesterase
MKVVIISDIHANFVALETAISSFPSVEKIWLLGDLAGYGPQPNECIEAITKLPILAIAGNHDLGVTGRISTDNFNDWGKQAIAWQKLRLSEKSCRYLKTLESEISPVENIRLVHGSPRDSVWEYLLSTYLAEENFSLFNERICFFGHTHLPVVYKKANGRPVEFLVLEPGQDFYLQDDEAKWLINPGSIGQPRDGHNQLSYLLFDTDEEKIRYFRLPYNYQETQELIYKAGLPSFLAERLAAGL